MSSSLIGLKVALKKRLADKSKELVLLDQSQRQRYLEDFLVEFTRQERIILPDRTFKQFAEQVMNEIVGLGPLERLFSDPDISEIMINGHNEIYIEKRGRIQQCDFSFDHNDQLLYTIDKIIAPLGLHVDEANPMVDARLPDGSRVNVILPPVSLCGPTVTIRRFIGPTKILRELIANQTMTESEASYLKRAVVDKKNIIVSGGTSSGKTTMLNVLSSFIQIDERLITIEDTAELQLDQPHVVSLESRSANTEGEGEVTIRDLVRNALRMRPDRIIVGEVRGAEALDMLQAMNTGHEGSLTTAHANSCIDLIKRLEVMVMMSEVGLPLQPVREQITASIDLIMQMDRTKDGARKVVDIAEVGGLDDGRVVVRSIDLTHKKNVGTV